jgi:hypothetical protein
MGQTASEGRRAEDFFAPKNPTASVGFEPVNLASTLPLDHRSRSTSEYFSNYRFAVREETRETRRVLLEGTLNDIGAG